MWYAIFQWRAEEGWRLRNVFEDASPDLARSLAWLELDGSAGSTALIEADSRAEAESFPQYAGRWRRLALR